MSIYSQKILIESLTFLYLITQVDKCSGLPGATRM